MPRHKITGTIWRGRTTEILRGLLVHTEGLGSEVVIKRLHKDVARDEGIVKAFLNEGRVGIALHHANIVDVFHMSTHSGRPEMVMQYLPGWSLDSVLLKLRGQEEQLDYEVAVAICHALACGASHMHEPGLVHRHITPGNVVVTKGGCPKLIDFGAVVPGTKKPASRYTAPEFFRKGGVLDARGDVYSIGAILYELTTGKTLFAKSGNPAPDILKGKYEAPTRARAGYPGLLATIVKRCMSRDPKERYQNADALLLALEHFAADNRYTLSSRAVAKSVGKLFETERPKAQENAKITVTPTPVTRIHFKRAPAQPPPVPKPPDLEVTAPNLAIG